MYHFVFVCVPLCSLCLFCVIFYICDMMLCYVMYAHSCAYLVTCVYLIKTWLITANFTLVFQNMQTIPLPNLCLVQPTTFKAFTACHNDLSTVWSPLQLFAQPPHSHLSHQTPLNRLLTPPVLPNPLTRICLITLFSIGFSLCPYCPTPSLAFVSSNSSQ